MTKFFFFSACKPSSTTSLIHVHRKFLLLLLLCVFLLYCAYTSHTCVSRQWMRGRKFLGELLEQQQIKGGEEGELLAVKPTVTAGTVDELLINRNDLLLAAHRTRTCADELNYSSSSLSSSKSAAEEISGNRQLPSALIIGVKKSGTRALLEFVRFHPDVRASGCEVHFFDRHYKKGLRWYRNRMPTTRHGQVTIEKTPSYFVTREVPKRVFQMDPKAKLLLVVRDPVTRAISDYTQASSKLATTRRFEEMAFVNGSRGVVNTKWGPIRIGLYCRHLQRWLQYFPLAQFLFISGERLISDPAYELQRVEEFLNLRPVISEKDFYFNTTKGFPCILRKSRPHCLGKTKGRNHPRIDSVALNRLRSFYRPFNRRFYEMTGMDFGWP